MCLEKVFTYNIAWNTLTKRHYFSWQWQLSMNLFGVIQVPMFGLILNYLALWVTFVFC